MMCVNDDTIIKLLNSGSVLFKRKSQWDNEMVTPGQINVCVTYHTGGQEGVRQLYLKGQVLVSESQEPDTQKADISHTNSSSLSLLVHDICPKNRREQQPELQLPVLQTDIPGSAGDIKNVIDTFSKAPLIKKRAYNESLWLHTGEKTYKNSHFKKEFLHKGLLKCQTNEQLGENVSENSKYHSFKQTLSSSASMQVPSKSGEVSYQCSQCGEVFFNKIGLDMHMIKVHANIHPSKSKPYECNKCDMTFTQKDNFMLHMFNHTEERISKSMCKENTAYQCCSQCFEFFSSRYTLERHVKFGHSTDNSGQKTYQCKICKKVFMDNEEYMLHMYIHTGEKPYPCSQCDKAFLQNSDLKKHMVTHPGERTYPCNICDKAFESIPKFNEHMKLSHLMGNMGQGSYQDNYSNNASSNNTEVRSYKCNQCDKSFVQIIDLKDHLEMHLGLHSEIYNCSLCDKVFRNKLILEEHMVNHNEESPYLSNPCDKIFLKNGNVLEKHIIENIEEKPLQCNGCGNIEIENEENQCQCGISKGKSGTSHTNILDFDMQESVQMVNKDCLYEPKIEIKEEEIDNLISGEKIVVIL